MPAFQLTEREREVLRYVALGWTSKEIAAELGISTFTVANHRKHVCRKFGIHSTAQLVAFAMSLESQARAAWGGL